MPVWSFPAVVNHLDGAWINATLDLGCRLYLTTNVQVIGVTAHRNHIAKLADLVPAGTHVLVTNQGVTGLETKAHVTLADGRDLACTIRNRPHLDPIAAAYGGTLERQWTYPATVERLTDGDTFTATVETGSCVRHRLPVRVAHCNAPEKDTAEGQAAVVWAERILTPGLEITLQAHSLEKYGRLLASAILPEGHNYRELLIAAGHAVPYEGGAR